MNKKTIIYKVLKGDICFFSSPSKKNAKDYAKTLFAETTSTDTIVVMREILSYELVDVLQPTIVPEIKFNY